jgi:ribosome-associated protein
MKQNKSKMELVEVFVEIVQANHQFLFDAHYANRYTFPMIEISPTIRIAETEIQLNFIRSSGPGGQNVNKVATSVQLRFDVRNSPSLDENVKDRLIKLAGTRMTDDGILVLEAKRYRSQEQNRLDAIFRFTRLIQTAMVEPRLRRATRPSLSAKAARVGEKKKRGEIKRFRRIDPKEFE